MKSKPLVSITIPTFNSEKSLSLSLHSVLHQSYKNIEILIMDSGSTDSTLNIAKMFTSNILPIRGGLLKSRIRGVKESKGTYIVLLDSDQILEPDTIERAVSLCEVKGYDMLALEEDVYENKTYIQKLFSSDRKVIESIQDYDPYTGVILPRFFKKSLLSSAIKHIPISIIDTVGGPDHAILYYESWLLSKKITTLTNAVKHMEASTLTSVIKKCYRWGYTGVSAKTENKYLVLMNRKERFRKGLFTKGLFWESIDSILLLVIKGIPYKIGYIHGLLKQYKIT